MDKKVFYRVIVPLLEVIGTALICISTPLKKANFYSELCNIVDDGQPLFNVLMIALTCDRCEIRHKKRGNNNNIKNLNKLCPHVLYRLPPWKDGEKHKMVKLIYEQTGRSGDYDRESRGLITDDGDTAFEQDWIDKFVGRELYSKDTHPKIIVITCDPNGGGFSSDTALVSAYYESNKMIICGLDSHSTKRQDREAFALAHVAGLRKIPRFRESTVVFVPENNMDAASFHLSQAMNRLEKVVVHFENGVEGWRTAKGSKTMYTDCAKNYLETEDCIYYDKDMVVANPFKNKEDKNINTKKDLVRQLRQWRKLVYTAKTAKGVPFITYSGKTDDNGILVPGQKDDLCMAFILNAAYSYVIRKGLLSVPLDGLGM